MKIYLLFSQLFQIEKSKGPSLEKAYLYSVDKQQVSFIDIASSSDEPLTPDSHQDNGTLTRSRTSASNIYGTSIRFLVFEDDFSKFIGINQFFFFLKRFRIRPWSSDYLVPLLLSLYLHNNGGNR